MTARTTRSALHEGQRIYSTLKHLLYSSSPPSATTSITGVGECIRPAQTGQGRIKICRTVRRAVESRIVRIERYCGKFGSGGGSISGWRVPPAFRAGRRPVQVPPRAKRRNGLSNTRAIPLASAFRNRSQSAARPSDVTIPAVQSRPALRQQSQGPDDVFRAMESLDAHCTCTSSAASRIPERSRSLPPISEPEDPLYR